jgi:hypothetical protein
MISIRDLYEAISKAYGLARMENLDILFSLNHGVFDAKTSEITKISKILKTPPGHCGFLYDYKMCNVGIPEELILIPKSRLSQKTLEVISRDMVHFAESKLGLTKHSECCDAGERTLSEIIELNNVIFSYLAGLANNDAEIIMDFWGGVTILYARNGDHIVGMEIGADLLYDIAEDSGLMGDIFATLNKLIDTRDSNLDAYKFISSLNVMIGDKCAELKSSVVYNFDCTETSNVVIICGEWEFWCESEWLEMSIYFSSMISAAKHNMQDARTISLNGKDVVQLIIDDSPHIVIAILTFIVYRRIPAGVTDYTGLICKLHHYGVLLK